MRVWPIWREYKNLVHMCASVYFLPRAAAAGWWWSLPMFYILASVIITYETNGWLVVVVGFQFSLFYSALFLYIYYPQNVFFFSLKASVCTHTHTHIERSIYKKKFVPSLYYIVYTHTSLLLSPLFSCLLLFWLLGSYKFLPPEKRLWAQT